MCCGKASWKKIVAFGLTFWLGIFISGLFVSGKVSQTVKPFAVPAEENKNCVPMDANLKYERLATDEKNAPQASPEDSKLKATKQEDPKTSSKTEIQKKSAEPRYYDSSNDPSEVKTLLHKERCFETEAQ